MAIEKPDITSPVVGNSIGVWGGELNTIHSDQDTFNGEVADKLNTFYSSLADMGLTDVDLTNGDLEASMITIFNAMQEGSRLLMDVTASEPNFLSILPYEGAITISKGSPNVATIMLETEGNGRYETSYDGTLVTKVEAFINLKTGKEDAFSKNTAFNKNFGNSADTVVEGNDIGDVSTLDTTSKEVVGATNELHGEINAIDNRIKNIEFDNVTDMKVATWLSIGDKVKTWGYYTKGDGGGAEYLIVAAATGTDDAGSYHDLSGISGQAELIANKCVYIKQFGCKGDGVTDDTVQFGKALEFLNPILIQSGIFLITDTLPNVQKYSMEGVHTVGNEVRTKSDAFLKANYSVIRFQPSTPGKPLIKVYETSSPSDTIGTFENKNIYFDLTHTNAGGLQFGLPKVADVNYIISSREIDDWDTIVDGSGQRYIFGANFDNCLLEGRDVSSQINREIGTQILLTRIKCFNSTAYKTSFYTGDIGNLNYGCDSPNNTECYYRNCNIGTYHRGSGTFQVYYQELNGWFNGCSDCGLLSQDTNIGISENRFESVTPIYENSYTISINATTGEITSLDTIYFRDGITPFEIDSPTLGKLNITLKDGGGGTIFIEDDSNIKFINNETDITMKELINCGVNIAKTASLMSTANNFGSNFSYILNVGNLNAASITGDIYRRSSGIEDNKRSEIRIIGNSLFDAGFGKQNKRINITSTNLWLLK